MVINVLAWLLFGAAAGWIASVITRTDEQFGAVGNIIIGTLGAFIGGALSRAFGGPAVNGFNSSSLIVAVIGSVVLLFLIDMISSGSHNRGQPVRH